MIISRDVIKAALFIGLGAFLVILVFVTILDIDIYISEMTVQITPLSTKIANNSDQDGLSLNQTLSPVPGVFSMGYKVKIFNTGGEGLRIRLEPGLDGQPMFLGFEGEEFRIIQGPNIDDNQVWWKIEGLKDTTRVGWASQEFLTIIN